MEVMYVEARYKGSISDKFLDKISEALKQYKTVNMVAAVQYLDQMEYVRQALKDKNFIVNSSKYRAMYPGQILGCDVYAAEGDYDATLAFTQGLFHALGVVLKYGRSIINVDPETESITIIPQERSEKYRKRMLQNIGLALTAKRILFVESTKSGQTYGVRLLKEALQKQGKTVFSLLADEFNFGRINELRDVDAIVNTACQRIGIDDIEKFEKPIVNAEDLEPYLLK